MKITKQEVFPILFYEFLFSADQIAPLVEEIQNKKEIIKKKYNDSPTDPELGVPDYWTDYNDPIKLLEYEKLIKEIPPRFLPELYCEQIAYWTAIYEKKGYHGAHNHNPMLYNIPSCNMSSVLSLSDIGQTDFFNPRQSDEIYPSILIPSATGRMIIFPAHILHRAAPHGKKDAERIVVSSNWRIYFFDKDRPRYSMPYPPPPKQERGPKWE